MGKAPRKTTKKEKEKEKAKEMTTRKGSKRQHSDGHCRRIPDLLSCIPKDMLPAWGFTLNEFVEGSAADHATPNDDDGRSQSGPIPDAQEEVIAGLGVDVADAATSTTERTAGWATDFAEEGVFHDTGTVQYSNPFVTHAHATNQHPLNPFPPHDAFAYSSLPASNAGFDPYQVRVASTTRVEPVYMSLPVDNANESSNSRMPHMDAGMQHSYGQMMAPYYGGSSMRDEYEADLFPYWPDASLDQRARSVESDSTLASAIDRDELAAVFPSRSRAHDDPWSTLARLGGSEMVPHFGLIPPESTAFASSSGYPQLPGAPWLRIRGPEDYGFDVATGRPLLVPGWHSHEVERNSDFPVHTNGSIPWLDEHMPSDNNMSHGA